MAPETLLDDRGRRIYWGWLAEARAGDEFSNYPDSGWSSVMTLPWHLYPSADNTLKIKPVEELEHLRYDPVQLDDVDLCAGDERIIESINSNCMEIKMTVLFEPDGVVGFKVLCSPDGREETVITYDRMAEAFVVDFEHSSLSSDLLYPDDSWQQIIPYAPSGKELALDVFVDRSVLEIFVNNDICIVQRVYPTLVESRQVRFFALHAAARYRDITKWEMDASNPW